MPQTTEIKHRFTIDENRWIHGTREAGEKGSQLLCRDSGLMCCLGFFALSCGVPRFAILDVGEPDQIDEDATTPLFRKLLMFEDDQARERDTPVVSDLITVNDQAGIDLPTREANIKTLFASIGVEVTFETSSSSPGGCCP